MQYTQTLELGTCVFSPFQLDRAKCNGLPHKERNSCVRFKSALHACTTWEHQHLTESANGWGWWFGARWCGILELPLSNNPFQKGIPGIQTKLVGGFNPFKNESKWESSPIFRMKINKYLSCHHPVKFL